MPEAAKILVIESDAELSQALAARLEIEGFKPQLARNRAQARTLLRNLRFDMILSDIHLPDGDVEQCYRDALPYLGSTPVIFTAAAGEVDHAVRLVKAGALDCLQKPYDVSDLVERMQSVLARRALAERCWPEPVMVSPAMSELGQRLGRLAGTSLSLIVTGESGSGKEVVMRHLHRLSPRACQPFVEVACASLAGPDGEKFLFGELDGGGQLKPGAFEEVGRGTLFLNEIEDMAPHIQNRLAQVMDEGRFRRIGDVGALPFDGRIVAATELSSASLRERLRPNLYHRLAVLEIHVPPLRERHADLGLLVEGLSREVACELGMAARQIDAEAVSALSAHDWPGNVRELRNRLVRAMSFTNNGKIGVEDLFPDIRLEEVGAAPLPTLEEARVDAERHRILDALEAHEGRIGHTARSLGISRVTLWAKMKRLGISNGSGGLFLVQKRSRDVQERRVARPISMAR